MTTERKTGRVYLVGAGPGDPELITVRGLRLLQSADVVLFDRLIATELLAEACAAELIDVGKKPGAHRMTQDDINQLIVDHALAGETVVRLKGGDPLTFGRGMEEFAACRANGIDCEIVPGVSSVHAVPAAAGIPLTHRGVARSYAVITGQSRDGELPDHDFAALARIETLVVLMGLSTLPEIVRGLIDAGQLPDTPAATIASGTTAHQRVVVATLATIAETAVDAGLESPVITVIGDVARFASQQTGIEACSFVNSLVGEAGGEFSLRGRRIVVTQAESTSTRLQRLLHTQGATTVNVPLIQITYPAPNEAVRKALAGLTLREYDVLAFTSVHGVRGFRHALRASGIAVESLRDVSIAALGYGTAEEARKLGLRVDIIPPRALADDLVIAIDKWTLKRPDRTGPRRVLFPRSSRALPTLSNGLVARGFVVTDPIVYQTVEAQPRSEDLESLRSGFDAILFCSPSAVQRFSTLNIDTGGAVIGCIGPTTADAAIQSGLRVDIQPTLPGTPGMVSALIEHFNTQEALA